MRRYAIDPVLHIHDVLSEFEHHLPTQREFTLANDRDRRELRSSLSSILRHPNKAFDMELIPKLDVENELLQVRTQHGFRWVFFGVQGDNER